MSAQNDRNTLPFDPLAERIARRTRCERKRIRLSDERFGAFIRSAADVSLTYPMIAWLLIPLALAGYVLVITVWCTIVVCFEVLTGKLRPPKPTKRSRRIKTHFHEV